MRCLFFQQIFCIADLDVSCDSPPYSSLNAAKSSAVTQYNANTVVDLFDLGALQLHYPLKPFWTNYHNYHRWT